MGKLLKIRIDIIVKIRAFIFYNIFQNIFNLMALWALEAFGKVKGYTEKIDIKGVGNKLMHIVKFSLIQVTQ